MDDDEKVGRNFDEGKEKVSGLSLKRACCVVRFIVLG